MRLHEMTPEVLVESSRMSSTTLTTNDLLNRVKGMVGKVDYNVLVPMRPECGHM